MLAEDTIYITGADKVTCPSLNSEKKKKSSEQIAIGIVHKLQDASTENALVDNRFCPAKGKPQTAHRPEVQQCACIYIGVRNLQHYYPNSPYHFIED